MLFMASSIHWGSWNIFIANNGELLVYVKKNVTYAQNRLVGARDRAWRMGEVGKLSFGFLKFNKLNTSNIDLYDIHCPIKSYMVKIKERNHFSTVDIIDNCYL